MVCENYFIDGKLCAIKVARTVWSGAFNIWIVSIYKILSECFAIFTISKRMANNSQNDLVNQLDGISKSMYTDLDQEIITGARLKQVVQQATTTDCAVIVASLGFLGAQTGLGNSIGYTAVSPAKPEATLNGNVGNDFKDSKVPVVQIEGMNLKTSLDNDIAYPLAANFGSVLKNSVTGAAGANGVEYTSMVTTAASGSGSTSGAAKDLKFNESTSSGSDKVATGSTFTKYDDTAEYGQAIKHFDGQFKTKLEFATDKSSRVLRYDMTSDFTKTGKTFSIPDTAQFNSYVLTNSSGEYMGLVFCQRRK